MRIEIWSDVVCPWCYIGKRRLEAALEGFEHADEVEVVYRSFELDPSSPARGTESVSSYLGRKYGGGEAAGRAMIARSTGIADEVELTFDYADAVRSRTVDAHRLLHLALETGGPRLQRELKEALLAAYFTRAEDMGDHDVLRKAAAGVGLDGGRVDEVLASSEFEDAVRADVAQAQAYGATGVPFFVIDERYGVAGAQPTEVFTQLLDRAWSDAHPAIELVGPEGTDGAVCGPDGCAV
ncbi:MAG: DsbA family oxidoreductase [Nocardioidaceae bacterium]